MQYKIVFLFSVAVLNSIFSFFVLRGNKKKTGILFSLVALSASLWSVFLGFFIETENLDQAIIFANSYYVAAAAIPMFFLYFTIFFPDRMKRPWSLNKYLYLLPFIFLIIAFLLEKHLIIKEVYLINLEKNVILNQTFYLLYACFFLFFVILSYIYLLYSYKNIANVLEKAQIKFILIGTSLTYLFGMYFNLFLPFIGDYSYIWLGPFFTLIMISTLGFAILKRQLFDVKVITTEILTFGLWFFILIRTIISDTIQDQFINGSLLVITVLFGILLVRSVKQEVSSRERIEQLAKDLEKANADLVKLDQAKSEFISIAGHQLRTPLTIIKGYSSMLLEGSFGKISEQKISEALRRIFVSSDTLTKLVSDLLDLSRIESGRFKYEFKKVYMDDIIERAIKGLETMSKEKGTEIKFKNENHKTFGVLGDADKLFEVVMNLLDNALKYSSGPISVILAPKSNRILLSVSDHGMGIPKGEIQKLFTKFGRTEASVLEHPEGMGLGLYFVKKIVDDHKGRIWVESPGISQGSTFFVELPISRDLQYESFLENI